MMETKEQVAERLARSHCQVEPDIERIVRVVGSNEDLGSEPVKLLEVNPNTVAAGIQPIYFGADVRHGIPFPSVIIEVTPDEFDQVRAEELLLPHGWRLDNERSEEHTSELQSRENLVCRLLLEKKK